jgi:hypothetical protein
MLTHSPSDSPATLDPEALIVYGLLIVVGAIPIATALDQRGGFGVEATVGLIMIVLGAVGALGCAWQALAGSPRYPADCDHSGAGSGGGSPGR